MTWPPTFGNICPGADPSGGPHTPAETTDDPPEIMAVDENGPIWEIDDVEHAFGLAGCVVCGAVYLLAATEIEE
jgi:hypothetical protein